MDRTYDIFEIEPDKGLVWKCSIKGMEDAIKKLKELAKGRSNEFRLMHKPTGTIIATINATEV
jgi:hypothetical protein